MGGDQTAPIAAIVHRHGAVEDSDLLAALAEQEQTRGAMVHGLVDEAVEGVTGPCGALLRDLQTGERYRIFQDLGAGASGCRIDPSGVALASIALRRAAMKGADLVIANRFGKLEASGGGLAQDMLAVMAAGIPFITLVAEDWLDQWRTFTGGAGEALAPDRRALDDWAARYVTRSGRVER